MSFIRSTNGYIKLVVSALDAVPELIIILPDGKHSNNNSYTNNNLLCQWII